MFKQIRAVTTFFAVAVIGTALIAASCSDGDDDTAPTAADAATHTTSATAVAGGTSHVVESSGISDDAFALHQAMRKLWEDHVTWTRLFIISSADGLADQDAVAGRLLQNQADIGKAVAGFYGEAAGNQLTALLREHILTAAKLLDAAKAGDKPATDAAAASWYANGDAIADFLSSANPNWAAHDLRTMMKGHLDLTLEEAVARITKDYAADIAAYDKVHTEILAMSDMLSAGIIAQFPGRF